MTVAQTDSGRQHEKTGDSRPGVQLTEELAGAIPLLDQGMVQRAQLAPNSLRPADVAVLQRTIGNSATVRLLGGSQASRPLARVRAVEGGAPPSSVQRTLPRGKQAGAIQRNFLEDQRRDWKAMPTGAKAMGVVASPLNAIPGAMVGGYKGATGAYGAVMAGGGQKPSRLRQAAAVGAGALGGIGGAVGGAVGGALWGLANPLWSGMKHVGRGLRSAGGYIGGKAKQVPGAVRQARGIYDGTTNYNADTSTDLTNYSVMGGSALGSASRFGMGLGTELGGQTSLVDQVIAGEGLTRNAQAIGGLGAGAGLLGAGSALLDAGRGFRQARDSSNRTSERRLGALNMGQGLASATQSVSSSAANIAGLAGNAGAMAGATLAVGGAGIATGAMDMLRGGYGLYKGKQRRDALDKLAAPPNRQQEEAAEDRAEADEEELIRKAARQASNTQQSRMDTGKANLAKGAVAIVGGALAIAMMTNPVGWGLLAGAAIIGGVAAFVKYNKRKKHKKEVAIRELGIEQERRAWKDKKHKVEAETWYGTDARAAGMAQIGPDPLDVALRQGGYVDVGHFYADYITKTAEFLFEHGVQGDNPKAKAVVEGMGLKVNKNLDEPQSSKPDVAKIAKSLHD